MRRRVVGLAACVLLAAMIVIAVRSQALRSIEPATVSNATLARRPEKYAPPYERCGLPRVAYRLLARAEAALSARSSSYGLAPHVLWYERGRTALELGGFPEGLEYLERTEQAAPGSPNLQYLLAMTHARLGNVEKALGYFRECATRENNKEHAEFCKSQLPPAADPASEN